MIKKKFIETRVHFKSKLINVISKIALTSDLWKAIAKYHHLALTGHFFNRKFQLRSALLGFKQIVGQHKSQNIRHYIEHELEVLGIKDKIVGITTDNAADMKAAVKKDLGLSISCLCHILNLTAQNGLCLWSKVKLDINLH